MSNSKIHVAILFGGRSAEHEISLLSARNVYEALDKNKYDVSLIGIDKEGRWCIRDEAVFLLKSETKSLPALSQAADVVTLVPERDGTHLVELKQGNNTQELISGKIDVVFPVLHGTNGEDGTVQGLLKLANIPYVGPDVLGSSVGMDKDVMKRLLRDAGVPIANFITAYAHKRESLSYHEACKILGSTVFIKPANLGSSVGISRATNEKEFNEAIELAFEFDRKILIEEAIVGRELECAVLGNEDPKASVVGEVLVLGGHSFYSYDAKYLDKDSSTTKIPADLNEPVAFKCRQTAIKAFEVLCCEGMARVDMFLRGESEVLINEINTIPGFTNISMYPKMWQATGISYPELIDQLLNLAIKRHQRDSKIKTSY